MYDRNGSGKITKEEMVDALHDLGQVETEKDEKGWKTCGNTREKTYEKHVEITWFKLLSGKIIVPTSVENLFSLMDFEKNKKIDEAEFLRCTMHYRSGGRLL